MKNLMTLLFALLFSYVYSQEKSFFVQKTNSADEYAVASARTDDAYYLLTIQYPLPYRSHLYKFSPLGEFIWAKALSIQDESVVPKQCLALPDGHLLLILDDYVSQASFANGNSLWIKMDPNGDVVWKKRMGSRNSEGVNAVVLDGDGFVALGETDLDDGLYGWTISRINADGELIATQSYRNDLYDYQHHLIKIPNGYVVGGRNQNSDRALATLTLLNDDLTIAKSLRINNSTEAQTISALAYHPATETIIAFEKSFPYGRLHRYDKTLRPLSSHTIEAFGEINAILVHGDELLLYNTIAGSLLTHDGTMISAVSGLDNGYLELRTIQVDEEGRIFGGGQSRNPQSGAIEAGIYISPSLSTNDCLYPTPMMPPVAGAGVTLDEFTWSALSTDPISAADSLLEVSDISGGFALLCETIVSGTADEALTAPFMYPNPVQSTLYVKSSQDLDQITVVDGFGRTVNHLIDFESDRLDVSRLLPGMYFLKTKDRFQNFVKID